MKVDKSRLHDEAYRWEVVERLIHAHGAELIRYCTARLGEGPGEDMTQDVLITAWESLPKYQPVASLPHWLFGIALKKCLQAYRNRTRRREIVQEFMREIAERVHADPPASPERSRLETDRISRLYQCLEALRENYRMVLILYYWQQLSVADIADVFGKREAAVRTLLARAKRQLREKMHYDPTASTVRSGQ